MTSSLEQIERLRMKLTERVAELNGDFLHESVLELSRQLDELLLAYLKAAKGSTSNSLLSISEKNPLPEAGIGK